MLHSNRISSEAHKKRMIMRKARRTAENEQYDLGKGLGLMDILPPASKAKRRQDLNRKHRRMFASRSFQKVVKAEQAKDKMLQQMAAANAAREARLKELE